MVVGDREVAAAAARHFVAVCGAVELLHKEKNFYYYYI
jgi:hypothetical protein